LNLPQWGAILTAAFLRTVMNITRFLIEPEGIFKEVTTRTPIQVEDSLVACLYERSILKCWLLDRIPGFGNVSATITQRNALLTVFPPSLTLNVTIGLLPDLEDGSKVCTPSFEKNGILCKLEWTPPRGMRVGFSSQIAMSSGAIDKCWLYAVDDANRFRLLPLPNVFDGADVCMGEYSAGGPVLDAFRSALNQFQSSPWNADLLNDRRREGCKKLFTFKVVKDGFEQLPVPNNWADHCPIVGNDTLATRVLL
jgi:hypothetical protein